jgi:hypothetical protein
VFAAFSGGAESPAPSKQPQIPFGNDKQKKGEAIASLAAGDRPRPDAFVRQSWRFETCALKTSKSAL